MTQPASPATKPASPATDAPPPPALPAPAPAGPSGTGRLGVIARSWPLGRRLAAALALTSIVLLTGVGLITTSLVRLEQSIHERTDILSPARTRSAQLMTSLVDQETGLRGYLLDGRGASLQPYDEGRADQDAHLARLDELVGGRPDLADELGALRARVADWHRQYA
ncbi:CHASE3 domain-containing protein, partial [Frankia sp. CNm7]